MQQEQRQNKSYAERSLNCNSETSVTKKLIPGGKKIFPDQTMLRTINFKSNLEMQRLYELSSALSCIGRYWFHMTERLHGSKETKHFSKIYIVSSQGYLKSALDLGL